MNRVVRCLLLCVTLMPLFYSRVNAGYPEEPLKNELGEDVFIAAIREGRCDVVTDLLERGSDPNRFFDSKLWSGCVFTGLFLACKEGRVDLVKALLDHGADVNLGLIHGEGKSISPIVIAVESNYPDILKILVTRPEVRLNEISTVHYSKVRLDVETMKPENEINDTALGLAARNGRKEIVEILLAAGADYRVAVNGRIPRQKAARTLQLLEMARDSLQGQESLPEELESVLADIRNARSVCELFASWSIFKEKENVAISPVRSVVSTTETYDPQQIASIRQMASELMCIELAAQPVKYLYKVMDVMDSSIDREFDRIAAERLSIPISRIRRVGSRPVKK